MIFYQQKYYFQYIAFKRGPKIHLQHPRVLLVAIFKPNRFPAPGVIPMKLEVQVREQRMALSSIQWIKGPQAIQIDFYKQHSSIPHWHRPSPLFLPRLNSASLLLPKIQITSKTELENREFHCRITRKGKQPQAKYKNPTYFPSILEDVMTPQNNYKVYVIGKHIGNAKIQRYEISLPRHLQKLPENCLSRNEVADPFGLCHAGRGEGDDDGVIPEEGQGGDSAQLHIELLLSFIVDLAFGLVDLEEVADDSLVNVVADRVPDLAHVLVELGGTPAGRVRVEREESVDDPSGLAFLEQERHHLVNQIWNNIPVLIVPLNSKIQLYFPPKQSLAFFYRFS